MTKFRLNRRTVLRGAGSIAIGLPWLEAMGNGRRANAQTAAASPKRFLTVFQPGGTVRANYTPTGTEAAPVLSTILKPLQPMLKKLIILDGLDMKSAVGEVHQSGMIAVWSGTPQKGTNQYGSGPSVDQVLAPTLSKGKRYDSLQFAVRWATGKSHGLLHPINALNFENSSPFSPIPPSLDPQKIFTDLFGSLAPGSTATVDANALALMRRKSILDFVDKKYNALEAKLGADDRAKLDAHLTKIRELETSLTVPPPMVGAACKPPTKVDTSDYNPKSGLNSSDNGSIKDLSTDAAIPKVGKFMMDMMVMALACDLTAVGTFQWSDSEAKHTFPWLNLSEHHHYYQHDGGFKPNECTQICTWYAQQHLYLLQQMDAVDMGGHSLLDETLVFFGSEIQEPPTHIKTNMPFLLAGGSGIGYRMGRWVKAPNGTSHNALLVSILNLFGNKATSFGPSQYSAPALSNLV
jgi:uncharacterized protein DUF1552